MPTMGDRRTGSERRLEVMNDFFLNLISVLQTINEIEGAFDDYRKEVLDQLGEEVFNPSVIANKAVEQ